jgi:hypothetical protein
MNRMIRFLCGIVLLSFFIVTSAAAKEIRNRHYKFRITLPETMNKIQDTAETIEGELFYDTVARVVLMISERQSNFNSVQDYIDCSKKQLATQLKYFYSDTTLTLINCSKSEYFSDKSTVILFRVSVLPYGFNTCLVYFFHHRHKDIQFSFTFKQESEKEVSKYIAAIMGSLKLK